MPAANLSLIYRDADVMGGAAVFVGSRLPVATLLACVDAGNAWERIVANWPWLTLEHLDAARAWAAATMSDASATLPTAPVDQAHAASLRQADRVRLLYLGISGVLHPSASLYELVYGRSPWHDGHQKYEAVPWLSRVLAGWPDVRVILTSTQPWKHGLADVLEQMGELGERVIGFTYQDLTTRPVRQVRIRSGLMRNLAYSDEDYWRMNKSDIVAVHVEWLQPQAWVAVDDEDILWPKRVADHVCIVDGLAGLQNQAEQDRLVTYLEMNFGRGSQP